MLPPAEQYNLRVEYRQWRPTLSSMFQKGAGAMPGTLMDAGADLAVDEEKSTYEIHGTVQLKPGLKLRGSYTRIDYDGDVVADRNLRFQETLFVRSTRIVTSMKGAYWTGELEFDVAKGSWGYFGVLVGGKMVDTDTVLVAPERGQRETHTLRAPAPVLGIVTRVYAGKLSLAGEISGVTAGGRGHVYEADGSVRLHLSDRLAVQGGYRYLKLQGEDEPDLLETDIQGFSFGFEVSL